MDMERSYPLWAERVGLSQSLIPETVGDGSSYHLSPPILHTKYILFWVMKKPH